MLDKRATFWYLMLITYQKEESVIIHSNLETKIFSQNRFLTEAFIHKVF